MNATEVTFIERIVDRQLQQGSRRGTVTVGVRPTTWPGFVKIVVSIMSPCEPDLLGVLFQPGNR